MISKLALATGAPQRVMSINLCADQLLLHVATPDQIVSLSWLSQKPQESIMFERARAYPANFGGAEELIQIDPDLVVGGIYTGDYTKSLARRRGVTVIELAPATSLDDVYDNIARLGLALGRESTAEALVGAMRARVRGFAERRPLRSLPALLLRAGGYTADSQSLSHALMELAGLRNVAAEQGLDRWGSLPMESLLYTDVELVFISRYAESTPALATQILAHPALRSMQDRRTTARVPSQLLSCGLPQSLDAVDVMIAAARQAL